MNNLLFIFYLITIISMMIILITYFFNNFIIIPQKSPSPTHSLPRARYNRPRFSWRIPFFNRIMFRRKLRGCRRGKCINGSYCMNCQGPSATCCCYDFQCSKQR